MKLIIVFVALLCTFAVVSANTCQLDCERFTRLKCSGIASVFLPDAKEYKEICPDASNCQCTAFLAQRYKKTVGKPNSDSLWNELRVVFQQAFIKQCGLLESATDVCKKYVVQDKDLSCAVIGQNCPVSIVKHNLEQENKVRPKLSNGSFKPVDSRQNKAPVEQKKMESPSKGDKPNQQQKGSGSASGSSSGSSSGSASGSSSGKGSSSGSSSSGKGSSSGSSSGKGSSSGSASGSSSGSASKPTIPRPPLKPLVIPSVPKKAPTSTPAKTSGSASGSSSSSGSSSGSGSAPKPSTPAPPKPTTPAPPKPVKLPKGPNVYKGLKKTIEVYNQK